MTAIAQAVHSASPVPTWKWMKAWIILIPLLYFSNGGSIGTGNVSAADYGIFHFTSLVAASSLCLLIAFKRPAAIVASSLKLKLIIALPILAFFTCAWSADPKQSLLSSIPLACFTLFALHLADQYTPDQQLDFIMLAGVVAVLASIALAIVVPSYGTMEGGAWRGIFPHKQQCAGGTTIFLLTALHWKPKSPLQRHLRALHVVLCFGLIGMTQSKIGWLLAASSLALSLCLWILQKFPSRDAVFLMVTGIPLLGALLYTLAQFADEILYKIGKDPTLNERTTIWAAAWVSVLQNPWFGYGYKTFWWGGLKGPAHNVILAAGWGITQAQSGYLDLWLSFGIGGIIIVALMATGSLLNGIRSFHSKLHGNFVRWCLVIVFCNLEYNVGESDFAYVQIVWLMFLVAFIGLHNEAKAVKGSSRLYADAS